ncbi:MAG: molecular chaperone TorD family protein [Bryobacterales bacterium]|nr:molecular chaperone TorD family protein [Bryobacterales bacterium]
MQQAITRETMALLQEAAEWRLLGLMFEYPSETWRHQISALLADLHQTALVPLAKAALESASPGLHFALFGPAGTVPVREVTYQGGVQLGYLMSELSGYYSAFGYEHGGQESDDHLAVELGFLSFLRMKEAYATLAGNAPDAQFAAEIGESFIRDHLALMVEPISNRLAAFAPEYLTEAGRQLLDRVGPAPRSDYPLAAILTSGDDSEEMSCGPSAANEELIHIQP